ncbi:MAG: hypothetical protein AAGK10_00920 [Cyanobacteria bacterium J06555_3]
MNKPQPRIPQEHTDEIFAKAAELQAKHEQSYSLAELKQIGAEAHISPEFIERATKQIQRKKKRESRIDLVLESLSNAVAVVMVLSFFTGFMGIPNVHCSLARTQPESSQTLPDS